MNRTVVLVDDDLNITNALRRLIRKGTDNWTIVFHNSADETLAYLGNHPVNILFSDIKMPGTDGFHLLKTVSIKYPAIVRIIFSGHYEEDRSLDWIKYAHQSLAKPVSASVITDKIDFICRLQEKLNNAKLESLIGALTILQSSPNNYGELLNALKSPEPSVKVVASLINRDVALTARVLQLVNSAFFGLAHRVTNCEQAIVLLGINNIKSYLLSLQIFHSFGGKRIPSSAIEKIWNHSRQVAALSRAIAANEELPQSEVDICMLAGLLHDIGKLVMLEVPAYGRELVQKAAADNASILDVEQGFFQSTHAEAGAYLLGIWGLDRSVVEIVLHHHGPDLPPTGLITLSTIVKAADWFVNNLQSDAGLPADRHESHDWGDARLAEDFEAWETLAKQVIYDKGGSFI